MVVVVFRNQVACCIMVQNKEVRETKREVTLLYLTFIKHVFDNLIFE